MLLFILSEEYAQNFNFPHLKKVHSTNVLAIKAPFQKVLF